MMVARVLLTVESDKMQGFEIVKHCKKNSIPPVKYKSPITCAWCSITVHVQFDDSPEYKHASIISDGADCLCSARVASEDVQDWGRGGGRVNIKVLENYKFLGVTIVISLAPALPCPPPWSDAYV